MSKKKISMAFRVNNIFYSLQGEGRNTGRAAAFVRFAGCNLRCTFCDTDYTAFTLMSAEDIVLRISTYKSRFVVLTGGEPTLQADESFVDLLHQHGFEVAMESNGTMPAPANLDWLTVSPKNKGIWALREKHWRQPDELKIVFNEDTHPEDFALPASLPKPCLCYLQPCDTGDERRNKAIVQRCVEYIKTHPHWRLSLQTHKLIDIE